MYNRSNIIDAIDEINYNTIDANLCVLESLICTYDKASIIMENYDGDDLSAFSIFQEDGIIDRVKKQGKGDSAIKRFLLFLPRLIIEFVKTIANRIKGVDEKPKTVPKDKAKAVKKKPNIFKRILTSKPVKTVALISTVAAGIETTNMIKSMNETRKNIMKANESIANSDNRKSLFEKFDKEYKPIISINIDDDGNLLLASSFDILRAPDIKDRYFENVEKYFRQAYVDIRSCKTPLEVTEVFTKLDSKLNKDDTILSYLMGLDKKNEFDLESANWFYLNSGRKALYDAMKGLKEPSVSEKIEKLIKDLVEATPDDKMNNMAAKIQNKGKTKQGIDEMLAGIYTDISTQMTLDLKQLAKVLRGVISDIDMIISQMLNVDISTADGKEEIKKAVSGNHKYDIDGEKLKRMDEDDGGDT